MFDSIIAAIKSTAQGIFDAFIRAGTTVWGIIVAGVGIVMTLIETVKGWIEDAGLALASVVMPAVDFSAGGVVMTSLGFANRLFPLSELFVLLIAWGLLCAVLMGYHVIKSWLPGVAAS